MAEKTADAIPNELAGTEIEKAPDNPLANSQKSDTEIFSGTYRCEELGTEWIVEPKEKEPGKWAVHMIPTDYREFSRIDFDPKRDKVGHLVFLAMALLRKP